MDEDYQYLHPNWKALSTVSFKYKIFKKASEITEEHGETSKSREIKLKEGEEAANVYKEVLEMPSSADKVAVKKKTVKIKKPETVVRKTSFDQNLLFRSATNNDPEKIQEMFNSNPTDFPINVTDTFGWTALMMAACEGSLEAFMKLHELGADLKLADKKGRTAKKLAEQKNQQLILEAIRDYEAGETESYELSDDEDEPVTPYFCKICKMQFNETTIRAHESSTLHLFNYKSKIQTSIKAFGISRSNKGYKMMMRLGWDTQSGLGQEGRGHLYPVKTTIRKGREGLGIQQTSSKITHFKAHDRDAIKYRSEPEVPSRKKILENHMKDKRLERKLRRELS